MRRLLFIKPPAGWAGFATELIIVVLGVLIALAAQEAVNDWNARRGLNEFRSAVNRELAENLASYEQRVRQSSCTDARLVQLETWQSDWRDGSGPTMLGRIRRPIGYTLNQNVWTSGAAASLKEMPLEERLSYAALYAALQTYDNLRLREANIWQDLYAYDQATSLTSPEVNKLRGLILAARSLSWSINANWEELEKAAGAMGIVPEKYTVDEAARRSCEAIEFDRSLEP